MHIKQLIIISLIGLMLGCNGTNSHTLNSPNNEIKLTLTNENGELHYQVSHKQTDVIETSELGLTLSGYEFSQPLSIVNKTDVKVVNDHYTLFSAKQHAINYQANQQTWLIENKQKQQLELTFSLSNDGVAFKYTVKGKPDEKLQFIAEHTSFNFKQDAIAWLQPIAEAQTGWEHTNPSYEEHYEVAIPVGTPSPSPAGWVFPALFKSNDTWVAISEANMHANSHASRLKPVSVNGEYHIGLPMAAEVFKQDGLLGNGVQNYVTPWRILAIGDLATVAESTLGTDLAAPQITMNTDFVKPGISSWSWGLLKDDFTTFEVQKAFIDHAAEMGWQYTLVDADWDRKIGWDKMATLVQYAAQKNIDIIVWLNSAGNWNTTPYTPKDHLTTAERRQQTFSRLHKMGVKGVKIDFFAGDGQSMIAYYHAILQAAAEHQLLVNVHGATLPRGLNRTYPHLMTAEAVRGFEMITFFQNAADKSASHSTILPFTRNLFDPMDFTPMAFNDIPNVERKTTNALELAQSVLFVSGIQHLVETPQGIKNIPYFVKDALNNLPASWDESRYIAGTPGKLAVFARRQGERWYIAGINGETHGKTLSLDLSFINGKSLQAITRGTTDRNFKRQMIKATADTQITLTGNDGFLLISQ
ncbi:glycoside hydrolase family 97 protein [Algibacillus agarilyticus]|uniref:glycoside hydrolase family 97 protein n=1 Tax=Algibacillus agarilyticus TaxID=2234133 RepID=UPI000DCF87E5|nr:glycoside hydrolase family 97 protein [Algibacillus agarilyticus]